MTTKEASQEILFMTGEDYTTFMTDRGIHPLPHERAHGIQYKDGHQEIVIDKDYYLRNGISEEYIDAIITHEQVELANPSPNAHYHALLAEYSFIDTTYGRKSLISYHNAIQKLYRQSDPQRREAFLQITQKR